ncbi:MAG: hypothetical protein CM1200mP34_3690 [Verrucomicrobiales bacterium]|nr:MAG: hypothetical protein CM1200mP34_3690 [Verrucomicrobiales bacterium]
MKKIIVSALAGLSLVSTAKAAKAAPTLEALLPAETVLVWARRITPARKSILRLAL